MDVRSGKGSKRSFDVGSKGISGYYDTMLGHLTDATPGAAFALGAWAWVLSWPAGTSIFRIGPVLTLANLIIFALIIWTLCVAAPLVAAFWNWSRWRSLEGQGLQTVTRNDHELRVLSFRKSDSRTTIDQTTQRQRMEEERTVNHTRRERLGQAAGRLAFGFGWLVVVAAGFGLFQTLTGHSIASLTHSPDMTQWAVSEQAKGNERMAHWLSRPDVRGVVGAMSVEGVVLWLISFLVVIPRLSDTLWLLYDGVVHAAGNQYIPGARVRENVLDEKTLNTLREQQVYGDIPKAPRGEAAERMAK